MDERAGRELGRFVTESIANWEADGGKTADAELVVCFDAVERLLEFIQRVGVQVPASRRGAARIRGGAVLALSEVVGRPVEHHCREDLPGPAADALGGGLL